MNNNHEDNGFQMSADPQQRITRLCAVALEAMKEHPDYLADDKLSVLITNDVTKSDWGKSECGMGFWNYDSPRDLINTLLNHIQAVGEGYGCGVAVMEMHVREQPDPMDILGRAVIQAMERMEREQNGEQ